MLKELFSRLDKPLDYVGQEKARRYMLYIFVVGYIISLFLGFFLSDLFYTLVFGVATFLLVFIVTIPSWPFYRKNPLGFKDPAKTR